jgi:hypothetical protein
LKFNTASYLLAVLQSYKTASMFLAVCRTLKMIGCVFQRFSKTGGFSTSAIVSNAKIDPTSTTAAERTYGSNALR